MRKVSIQTLFVLSLIAACAAMNVGARRLAEINQLDPLFGSAFFAFGMGSILWLVIRARNSN